MSQRPSDCPGIVVAFHTPDPIYSREADRLRRSLDLLGLKNEIRTIESQGEWVRNAGQKPKFLAEMRRQHSEPILYVDVDAVFHRNPWLSLSEWSECDLAFHRTSSGELLSGTLLIGDTPEAEGLLDEWRRACEASPQKWDQVALDEVLQSTKIDLKVGSLPADYCWIFDKESNGSGSIVIEHLQASREGSERRYGFILRKKLRLRRQRIRQIDRVLGRR